MISEMMENSSAEDLLDRVALLHAAWPECGFISTEPAARWDFGTAVGNGVQGALAFCRPYQEELVLSHEELFLPLFPWHGYLPVREHYETIRNLVLEGRAGEALVAWRDESGMFHRRCFISRAADVIVLTVSSPGGHRFDMQVGLREIAYVPEAHPKAQDIYAKTIDRCESNATETMLTHRMHLKQRWDDQKILGSVTMARVIVNGGTHSVDEAHLHIHDAEEVLLLIQTVPDRKGELLDVEQIATALLYIEPDYAALLLEYQALRTMLHLTPGECRALSGQLKEVE